MLRALAERVAAAQTARTNPRAILLSGSVAAGTADFHSDLDILLYHDRLPTDGALAAARRDVGGGESTDLAPPEPDERMETYTVDGVDVQIGHVTIERWERTIRSLVEGRDPESAEQKAVEGLFYGIPLHGAELIERWRAEAVYSDALQRAMVERHWRFPPIWYVADRVLSRDAAIWRQEMLVDASFNLLGVLAGLNRVWYSRFQFKRMRSFTAKLELAPPDLADRLERVFSAEPSAGIAELEELVAETQKLLREHLPEVDASLRFPPGTRA